MNQLTKVPQPRIIAAGFLFLSLISFPWLATHPHFAAYVAGGLLLFAFALIAFVAWGIVGGRRG